MKYTQRLDYGRLAEVLHERGLAGLDAIRELLQLSQDGGMPFCEALVTSNLVSDWDLSKVVCETFQLPFLPLDLITPNPAALEEINVADFQKHQLVPLDVFGQVLTVVMPGLVPAEVLAHIAAMSDFEVLPVVGTVESNRRWITENMAEVPPAAAGEGGWESMFDEADASLEDSPGADADSSEALSLLDDPLLEEGDTLEESILPMDDGSLEIEHEGLDLGAIESLPMDEIESAFELDALDDRQPDAGESGGGPSPLPPMPKFNPDQREAS
ncbi:MAG: hypothetical protein ACJA2W_000457 [Planctomycetota bacterium]